MTDSEKDYSFNETDTWTELEIIEEKLKSKEEVWNHFQNLKDKVYSIVTGGREKIWQRNKKRNLYSYFNVELFEWADFEITKPLKKIWQSHLSLNSGKWLCNNVVDNAIQCLINKHNLNDFVGVMRINACEKILWIKKICFG